jgi:hypothetical protein
MVCCGALESAALERQADGAGRAAQDILAKFNGKWTLTPLREEGGAVTGCAAVLDQDLLPKGGAPARARACTVSS